MEQDDFLLTLKALKKLWDEDVKRRRIKLKYLKDGTRVFIVKPR